MAQNMRRGEEKQLRRDQQVRREVRQEVGEEIRSGDSQPLIRRPNRDQARGDWDRSGDHRNVGYSRAPEDEEGFDERK
jgi:hypothetical protein